jgi:hypothetical protein
MAFYTLDQGTLTVGEGSAQLTSLYKIPHTKLFVDNCQIVFVRESANLHGGFSKKIDFQVYHFSGRLCQPGSSQ